MYMTRSYQDEQKHEDNVVTLQVSTWAVYSETPLKDHQ